MPKNISEVLGNIISPPIETKTEIWGLLTHLQSELRKMQSDIFDEPESNVFEHGRAHGYDDIIDLIEEAKK